MRNPLFSTGLVSTAVLLLAVGMSRAQSSAYFQAVTYLKPAAYWPLQETNLPPAANVETNLTPLGPVANAYYNTSSAVQPGVAGAIVSEPGDTAVGFDNSGAGGFLAVPTTDHRVSVPAGPFTVEAWVYPQDYKNYVAIISQAGPNPGGPSGSSSRGGWVLSQNYLAYADGNGLRGWSFHVYNSQGAGNGQPQGGAEAGVPFNYQLYTWYHLVGVFDGTNCTLYVDGTNETPNGYQIPMTGSYVPDTWDPLCIGCGRGLNDNRFGGSIDEVAIYTNALTAAQILNHYNAGVSSSPSTPYEDVVEADTPYVYWRMDAPTYNAPDPSTYPVATNYGSLTNADGYYYPGTLPGMPGPFGPGSYACAINGLDSAIVVGRPLVSVDPTLNPIDSPVTVMLWFKSNPADARFQILAGHGDKGKHSWRVALDKQGYLRWNAGEGVIYSADPIYNDGHWHFVVASYVNGGTAATGTNYLYVDGALDNMNTVSGSNVGTDENPMLGGDPDSVNTGPNGYGQVYAAAQISQVAFFTNGLSASQVASLYALADEPPFIVAQPTTGSVNPNPDHLFFGVTVRGAAPLSYQWYFNSNPDYAGATRLADDGVKYVGSTTPQVTVSNLVASDSGYYFVVITNNYGAVTSALASLKVDYAPVITAQSPSNSASLFLGQSQTLSVTAISETNLFYQWFTQAGAIPDATNATYTTPSATPALAGVTVSCVVSNSYGAATNLPVTLLSVLPLPAALTNSAYGSNVLALAPTAYWPMHETEPPLAQRDIETNYGTLGSVADGYFGDWRLNNGAPMNSVVMHQYPGALSGSADPATYFTGQGGSYLLVPRTSPQTTIRPPFTLEAWVKPFNDNPGIILGVGDQTLGHGLNGSTNQAGFDWMWDDGPGSFSLNVRSGVGTNSAEPMTTASYEPGQWYYLVTTFDGTNVTYYINGARDYLQNSSAATMAPNTWEPITIGGGRWTGDVNDHFAGAIDEVAVYTNVLSGSQIAQHYSDGTSGGAGAYENDVLTAKPLLYYRMDSPPYAAPPVSEWPVLTNFGTAAINGVYTPNAAPGAGAGPSEQGIPVAGLSANTALAADGYSIFANAGSVPAFSPTGNTPFTVMAWMKGNPADVSDRNWQAIVSHSDTAWRLNLDNNNGRANFNAGPGGGSDIGNSGGLQINDGQWHQVAGTFDGINFSVYVDGQLSATVSNPSASLTGPSAADVFLGGYPSTTDYHGDMAAAAFNELGRSLAGSLCEAAFWNGVALSSNQIASLFNASEVAPLIEIQPISANVNQNRAFTNTVVAAGTGPLTYQWFKDGAPVSGQTNASLILNPVQPSDASADYFAVVANSYGSATSAVVSLTVFSVPTITQEPARTNLTLFAGGHATFSITAVGAVPLAYQWYSNNVALGGATNGSYTLANAQPPNSTNNYYCMVTNAAGSATSLTVAVGVLPDPVASYPATILAADPLGFWRLNEPDNGSGNNGVVAHDYWGGNDGIYTNTVLGLSGYNPDEPSETSAEFGILAFVNSMVSDIPANVDFGAPSGGNASFSVECWVNGYSQTTDAGIVSKGTGGNEQFCLDTGSDSLVTHGFRFFVRDASGVVHSAPSAIAQDGQWHHVVGVCDEANGSVTLYVDGVEAGTGSIPPGSGILESTNAMKIGSRPGTADPANNNRQFVGNIDDVAVYNYALSASQVRAQYDSADIPAQIITEPTNVTVGEFGTAIFHAVAQGTPPISYQWYNGDGSVLTGETNANLVLANVQSTDNGKSFYLVVSNYFSTAPDQSPYVQLTVVSGAPQIYADVHSPFYAIQGGAASNSVTAYGTEPLTYRWQFNGVNLSDGNGISGSQSNALTIVNAQNRQAGSYQVIVSNSSGSVTSSPAMFVVIGNPIGFYGNGLDWQENGGATITNDTLTLVDGGANEARSSFLNLPQYIGAFKAAFTYQQTEGTANGGVAFILQNDPRGPTALGGTGGHMGVNGISPSIELELNGYPKAGHGVGYGLFTDGNNGINTKPGDVNFWTSGDPVRISVEYAEGLMTLAFTDAVAQTSFSTNLFVGDLPSIVQGDTAYVGFSGSDGSVTALLTISNFTFVSIPTAAISTLDTNVVVTWPGAVGGYALQRNSDLTTTNWIDVTNLDNLVNGDHQIVLPVGAASEFYRLKLQ